MSEHDQRKEIPRLYKLLLKMTELAEHVEQTGSFESAVRNSVKRYNAIVERLEDIDAIPGELFHRIDEDADFGQLGAEAMLLADYLKDLNEEADSPPRGRDRSRRGFDPGPLIALAPFLDSNDLGRLVRDHFVGQNEPQEQPEREEKPASTSNGSGARDLRTIAALARHLKPEDVSKMVRTSLASQKDFDPEAIIEIARHLNPDDLSAILHEYVPEWFGESGTGATENDATPKTPPSDWYNATFPDHPQQTARAASTPGTNLVPQTGNGESGLRPAE